MSLFGKPNVKGLRKRKNVDKLIELLDHKWVDVRKEVAEALEMLGDKRATGALLKRLLIEHNGDVEDRIASALAEIDDPTLIPNVQALLLMMKKREEHKFQMESLIKVLDAARDKSAALPLIFLLDDMAYVSTRASEALTKKGSAVIPLLRAFLSAEGQPFFGNGEKGEASSSQGPRITYALNERIVGVLEELGWSPENDEEQNLVWYYKGSWERLAEAGKEGEKLLRKRARTQPYVRRYLQRTELQRGHISKLKKWLNDKESDLAVKAFKELEQKGSAEAEKLLFETALVWLKKTADYGFNQKALEYLYRLGTPEVRQPILEHLFRDPHEYGHGGRLAGQGNKTSKYQYSEDPVFEEHIEKYRPLFQDYAHFILKLAGYKTYIASYQFYYPMEEKISCVQELGKIKSRISSNILWLTKGLKSLDVLDKVTETGRGSKKKLDFEPVKKIARKELEARGNPEYWSEAYLDDCLWEIST